MYSDYMFQFIAFMFHCHFVHWFLSCMQYLLSSLCFVPEECLNSVNVMSFSIFPSTMSRNVCNFVCLSSVIQSSHFVQLLSSFFCNKQNWLKPFLSVFSLLLKILFFLHYLSCNWWDFFVLYQYLHFHSKSQCFIQ